MRKLMNVLAVLVLVLAVSLASCIFVIHYMNAKSTSEYTSVREHEEKKYAEEISRLKESEQKALEQANTAENKYKDEIARLRASEHKAVVERNRAQNEAELLRTEKESLTDTANRYKNQLDAVRKENEQLKAEVTRLKNKLDNSLVRIANPFK